MMRLRVLKIDLFLKDCTTRIPFRFGMSTLTSAPICTARVRIEDEKGKQTEGFSADLLVPKWFEKNAKKSAADDIAALLSSVKTAATLLTDATRGDATVFDHWWDLYADLVASQPADSSDLLVHGFGVALLERAMMDAVCRAVGKSFAECLQLNIFGFDPIRANPNLRDWDLSRSLPNRPAELIHVRHTVGMLDAIRESDVAESERVNDGFPESLEADIARYGLTHFKIKLCGKQDDDLRRLMHIAETLESTLSVPPRITLDGNEQYKDLNDLAELLEELNRIPAGVGMLNALNYIEQPLSRSQTFEVAPNQGLTRVEKFAPLLIDEADAELSAFPRAIKLGYRGVSVKNCKGIFRALINRGLCDISARNLFQSAEDLTNLPLLALQQDLTTVAAMGLTHVERNGHHFFRGLDHLPNCEINAALVNHADLYSTQDGTAALRIENGSLCLGSLQQLGFGYSVEINTDERIPLDSWS